jgi:predicted GNAT family N-acyltransferase
MEVVELEPGDAGELRALWDDFEPWAGRDVGDVRAGIRGSNVVLGVRSAGDLVAAARLVTDGTFYGTVYDVIVAADRRGEGFGRAVVAAIVDHEVATDLEVLDLRCREGLVSFYERFGFAVHDPTIEVDGREESFVKMNYESPE